MNQEKEAYVIKSAVGTLNGIVNMMDLVREVAVY